MYIFVSEGVERQYTFIELSHNLAGVDQNKTYFPHPRVCLSVRLCVTDVLLPNYQK